MSRKSYQNSSRCYLFANSSKLNDFLLIAYAFENLHLPVKEQNKKLEMSMDNQLLFSIRKEVNKTFIYHQSEDLQVSTTLIIRSIIIGTSSKEKVVKQIRNHPGSMQ